MRRQMEHPVSRRLVLPLTRLEQVADDRHGSGTTNASGRLVRPRKAEHFEATRHQQLDQLRADESGSPGDKRGHPCVGCHVASLEWQRPGRHPQRPYRNPYKSSHGRVASLAPLTGPLPTVDPPTSFGGGRTRIRKRRHSSSSTRHRQGFSRAVVSRRCPNERWR